MFRIVGFRIESYGLVEHAQLLNQAKSKTKYQDVARTKLFQVAGQNMIEYDRTSFVGADA